MDFLFCLWGDPILGAYNSVMDFDVRILPRESYFWIKGKYMERVENSFLLLDEVLYKIIVL